MPGIDEDQEEAQAGPYLRVGPHLGTRQSMTAENLEGRMRSPRFGVVYRNFQLSWAELRRMIFTKPIVNFPNFVLVVCGKVLFREVLKINGKFSSG